MTTPQRSKPCATPWTKRLPYKRDYPGYLFDLDGTLVDTAPDINAALNHVLANSGYASVSESLTRHWVGHGARACLTQALEHNEVPEHLIDEMLASFLERYHAHVADLSKPYPGAVETLQTLLDRGARLGVVTNKHSKLATKLLDELELTEFFACTICGDSTPHPKPAADPTLLACQKLDLPPADVLFVGDSTTDVASARAAGCAIVCVPEGYNHGVPATELGADAIIDSLQDLV